MGVTTARETDERYLQSLLDEERRTVGIEQYAAEEAVDTLLNHWQDAMREDERLTLDECLADVDRVCAILMDFKRRWSAAVRSLTIKHTMGTPPKARIPDIGRRCAICGKTQTTGEGLAGFRALLESFAASGLVLKRPESVYAHPRCTEKARRFLKELGE
jgi:hypothetical protein